MKLLVSCAVVLLLALSAEAQYRRYTPRPYYQPKTVYGLQWHRQQEFMRQQQQMWWMAQQQQQQMMMQPWQFQPQMQMQPQWLWPWNPEATKDFVFPPVRPQNPVPFEKGNP